MESEEQPDEEYGGVTRQNWLALLLGALSVVLLGAGGLTVFDNPQDASIVIAVGVVLLGIALQLTLSNNGGALA